MRLFWPKGVPFEEALDTLRNEKLFTPFNEEVLLFTQALSKRLVRMKHMPEIVALGYWLRKANVQKMQHEWEKANIDKIVRPRGTVFHIAPSNVDTIFVYSWMLSLLAGNRNVIRISSKESSNLLLGAILHELAQPAFQNIASQTIICTYSHEENATEILSHACHTRVIWGGDDTVKAIRQIVLAPMANELSFPDRFSLATLSSEAVLALDEGRFDQLLEHFYNDVFWFDQMACSSPRLVIWVGRQQEEAKARFWAFFEKKVQEKQLEMMAATQVLKYTTSLLLATESSVTTVENNKHFSRIQLVDLPVNVRERHCGGGLFYEYDVERLEEIATIIMDKDQTLAYFGFNTQELREFIGTIQSRGLDRIVPIGQALNFDGVWDGQSFLKSFTREVVLL